LEGYGRFLKSSDPPPAEWRLDQAREALRCFRKGIENWSIRAAIAEERVEGAEPNEVNFRVRTRGSDAPEGGCDRTALPAAIFNTDGENLVLMAERQLTVRRYARRTAETYLGWIRRYLSWTADRRFCADEASAVKSFLEFLALERKVSAATQNQALSALLFLVEKVREAMMRTRDLNITRKICRWVGMENPFPTGSISFMALASSSSVKFAVERVIGAGELSRSISRSGDMLTA